MDDSLSADASLAESVEETAAYEVTFCAAKSGSAGISGISACLVLSRSMLTVFSKYNNVIEAKTGMEVSYRVDMNRFELNRTGTVETQHKYDSP